MDSFFNLRAEKQEHIINAALNAFGRNGYKKASIADIAKEAGIAKGMVMYYFGSKKNLYLYLVNLSGKLLIEEIERGMDQSVTDFFDKIKMVSDIKIAMMKKHPAIISFLSSMFFETDEEVRDDIKAFISDGIKVRAEKVFDGTDVSKFKDDVDPKLLNKFILWAGEGLTNDLHLNDNMDKVDVFIKDFYECLDFMKKYFYKR
ncbi:TetR/AcrR family transcriptional regulator [Lachnoclostridium phytofermentans]|uniref:Transcriptional regulator, TetR family n=1 Tax=Lachnoclostridium phytofermentans (strain ATCC 700394 / DSM 18823 / ISDg) TaxID=357809 RepID=A9KSZ5_LACP7|nr:TetR/AcrR family transcriptional regulator [Lachnoclostridium phytofermentans]ABX42206.1 transcriptional regulator, TetR family [Lachnoclostridium phytofermentans ISDg]